MGGKQSCCASKKQSYDIPYSKTNNLQPVKEHRSSSVPHVLKEGTPAYEVVVTPKSDLANGCVSEKDLHKASSKDVNPQNVNLVAEDIESQHLPSKTLTVPNLDKEDEETTPSLNWEHTQSLDIISKPEREEEIKLQDASQEFIELRVKHEDGRHRGEAEIVYIESIQEQSSDETVCKDYKVVMHDVQAIHSAQNEKESTLQINHQEINSTIQKDNKQNSNSDQITVTSPETTLYFNRIKESGRKSTSSNESYPRFYNIFDIEFRRHTEGGTRSNYSSYSSSYNEARTSASPSPKVEYRKLLVTTSNPERNQISVETEINLDMPSQRHTLPKHRNSVKIDDVQQSLSTQSKLYSSVVKEGGLQGTTT